MKTLQLHVAWAIVALAGTMAGVIATRRESAPPEAVGETRSNAALKARISQLEAELAARRTEDTPAKPAAGIAETEKSPEGKVEVRASGASGASLTVDQIRALLKS